MSGHRVLFDLMGDVVPFEITDPGDAGAIIVDRNLGVVPLVSAGSGETRTLAAPTQAGVVVRLAFKTGGGGNIVVTTASAYNQAGDTTITFTDAGDVVTLISVPKGAAYVWRVANLDSGVTVGQVNLPIGIFTEADGTALTVYAAGSATPGYTRLASKEVVLAWDGNAAPDPVAVTVPMPQDLNSSENVELHYLAAMAGATDTPEMTNEAFFNDGDTDCAGTDDEIDGGTTLTEYSMTILAADVPTSPSSLTLTFTPKATEMGTDELYLYAAWLEYTPITAIA